MYGRNTGVLASSPTTHISLYSNQIHHSRRQTPQQTGLSVITPNFCKSHDGRRRSCRGRNRFPKTRQALSTSAGRGLQLLVVCLTSQQHVSVFQGRICSHNRKCRRSQIETAQQTFYVTHSQIADTRPTRLSADPRPPGAQQGSHYRTNFKSLLSLTWTEDPPLQNQSGHPYH